LILIRAIKPFATILLQRRRKHKAVDWIGRPVNDLVGEVYIDRSVTMEVLKKKRPISIIQKAKNTVVAKSLVLIG